MPFMVRDEYPDDDSGYIHGLNLLPDTGRRPNLVYVFDHQPNWWEYPPRPYIVRPRDEWVNLRSAFRNAVPEAKAKAGTRLTDGPEEEPEPKYGSLLNQQLLMRRGKT